MTEDGCCQTLMAHYHKEGVGNLIGGGSSKMLATCVMEEYEGDCDSRADASGELVYEQ